MKKRFKELVTDFIQKNQWETENLPTLRDDGFYLHQKANTEIHQLIISSSPHIQRTVNFKLHIAILLPLYDKWELQWSWIYNNRDKAMQLCQNFVDWTKEMFPNMERYPFLYSDKQEVSHRNEREWHIFNPIL